MKDYSFSEYDIDCIEFYISQGLPNVKGPLTFDYSDESSSDEVVTWIDGADFTVKEVVRLRNGKVALGQLSALLGSLVSSKSDIPRVLEVLYQSLVRRYKIAQ